LDSSFVLANDKLIATDWPRTQRGLFRVLREYQRNKGRCDPSGEALRRVFCLPLGRSQTHGHHDCPPRPGHAARRRLSTGCNHLLSILSRGSGRIGGTIKSAGLMAIRVVIPSRECSSCAYLSRGASSQQRSRYGAFENRRLGVIRIHSIGRAIRNVAPCPSRFSALIRRPRRRLLRLHGPPMHFMDGRLVGGFNDHLVDAHVRRAAGDPDERFGNVVGG
jgi:hypothetical protein